MPKEKQKTNPKTKANKKTHKQKPNTPNTQRTTSGMMKVDRASTVGR
jgi:hypothetical protein